MIWEEPEDKNPRYYDDDDEDDQPGWDPDLAWELKNDR